MVLPDILAVVVLGAEATLVASFVVAVGCVTAADADADAAAVAGRAGAD